MEKVITRDGYLATPGKRMYHSSYYTTGYIVSEEPLLVKFPFYGVERVEDCVFKEKNKKKIVEPGPWLRPKSPNYVAE